MNTAQLFNDDTEFLEWTKGHPEAFVLNFRANRSADYIVLHRASCRTIAVSNAASGPLTTGAYRKVGGRDPTIFDTWIQRNIAGGQCVSDECIICKPRR
ncbi:MAG: hypothetical protein WC804_07085 [Sphingomonas sp.]|jgi:hypothetical protein|uniref:hypothetical protein n=1 Tax=Sphingomonas sp. TaxID=28214 RepID=UPI003563BE47